MKAELKAKLKEDKLNGYDYKELVCKIDGFSLYKRKNFPVQLVKRYCWLLDQDYNRNKITVCAHTINIWKYYSKQWTKDLLNKYQFDTMDPYMVPKSIKFPYEKKEEVTSPTKVTKDRDLSPNKIKPSLLQQQLDILGIAKRIYLNFDKDLAANMFGYRHRFVRDEMRDFGGKGAPLTHKFAKEIKFDEKSIEDEGSKSEGGLEFNQIFEQRDNVDIPKSLPEFKDNLQKELDKLS